MPWFEIAFFLLLVVALSTLGAADAVDIPVARTYV
jgi:hypothetical protein